MLKKTYEVGVIVRKCKVVVHIYFWVFELRFSNHCHDLSGKKKFSGGHVVCLHQVANKPK